MIWFKLSESRSLLLHTHKSELDECVLVYQSRETGKYDGKIVWVSDVTSLVLFFSWHDTR